MAKQKFKVTNWRDYNKALINRGSVTFWFDDELFRPGMSSLHTHRGDGLNTILTSPLPPSWSLNVYSA